MWPLTLVIDREIEMNHLEIDVTAEIERRQHRSDLVITAIATAGILISSILRIWLLS